MISVIIPVGEEEPHLFQQVKDIHRTIGAIDYEIILVTIDKNLCSSDPDVRVCLYSSECCAGAKNIGAAIGKGTILVFSDAHTEYTTEYSLGWGETIERALSSRNDLGIVSLPRYTLTGPINNRERHLNMIARGLKQNSDVNLYDVSYITPKQDGTIPFIWADFIALSKDVFDDIGGFITEGWGHMDDRCYCMATTLFGYKNVCLDTGPMVGAYIRPQVISFPHAHLGDMCTHSLHLTGDRLSRAKDFWVREGHPPDEFEIVFNRWKPLRDHYLKHRVHDDDWYFTEFLPTFR